MRLSVSSYSFHQYIKAGKLTLPQAVISYHFFLLYSHPSFLCFHHPSIFALQKWSRDLLKAPETELSRGKKNQKMP